MTPGVPSIGKWLFVQFDSDGKPEIAFQGFVDQTSYEIRSGMETEIRSGDGTVIARSGELEYRMSIDVRIIKDPETGDYFKTTFDD